MLRPSNQLPDDAPSQPPSTKVNQATIKGGRQLKKPTQDSYVHQRDEPGHCKAQHGFKVKGIRFLSLDRRNQNLPDSPPHLPDHPMKMQRLQIEWDMRCHPLRAMAHMSARSRGTSQPLTLSSTHSPTLLISLILSLSLE